MLFVYSRRQWTEFNVPMMLGGCGSLGIILIIFIVTIYTHFHMRKESSEEGDVVRIDENEVKGMKDNFGESKDKEKTKCIEKKDSEKVNEKVNQEENEIEEDEEEMKEKSEKKKITTNESRNEFLNLFEVMRRSVYFTTVLFLSFFHAVSSFSNSFIIEVRERVCVCVCV